MSPSEVLARHTSRELSGWLAYYQARTVEIEQERQRLKLKK